MSLLLLAAFDLRPASALPAFARQTGQPCGACHTAIPELRPFGRIYKLNGYQLSDGEMSTPQLALWTIPGFTRTRANQDEPPQPHMQTNNNLVDTDFHAFVAGKFTEGLGGMVQWNYNPYVNQVNLDDTDVRYVKNVELFGKNGVFGLTVNNAPTFQDVWNTTNNWSWPQFSSPVAAFSTPGTFIDSLGQQVAGAGLYLWWNDMLYMEAAGYRSLPPKTLTVLGQQPGPSPDAHEGAMPYWRVALEPHWGDHYLMVGTFGMYGNTIPGGDFGLGMNQYLDVGFDAQYQYDGQQFQFTLKASNIVEKQTLGYSLAVQGSNPTDWLNSFKLNATAIWDSTYALQAGYFSVKGSTDAAIWSSISNFNSPTGDGLIFDASYYPYSKGQAPGPDKQFNMRVGVQYTKYLRLYGGTTNAINATGGTRNASGNDTLWLYAMAAF